MKKYIFTLLTAALIGNIAHAQANNPYEMMVDGVKIIVQPSGNDIVEIQTVIKGGVTNYPADKEGIENIALDALTECGTLNHDKNSFKDALNKVSASMSAVSNKNYSYIRLNCIKMDFNTVWPLYVEAITQPRFDTAEFSRLKLDEINGINQNSSAPDASIDKLADQTAFAGRNYAEDPQGTADIVSKITAAQAHAYYNSILTRSRMVIVVVASLDRSVIENSVHALLVNIKKGAPYTQQESFFRAYKNTFVAEQKAIATNYVEGITSGPQEQSPDYNAFNIAMRIFYDRHFLDIRTKNGLSYAPEIVFTPGLTSSTKIMVTTTQPDKYIAVFNKLVDSTKEYGFTKEELANMKTTYLTGFYYRAETNTALAGSIVDNEVMHGDWKRSQTLISDVNKLTLDDINNAFHKYIGNIVWVYQGDTKKVTPTLFINGTGKPDNPVSQ